MDELNTTMGDTNADLWPMGAVTRRTGISEHTLRAWERRFGFPVPMRLPSGHRRYTSDQVRQLLLINRALSCGYRAGDVVPLPIGRIDALVRQSDGASEQTSAGQSSAWIGEVLTATLAFDEFAIRSTLASDAATLGVTRFLRERAAPLVAELGAAWERGDIGVRHEHFVSGILENSLRALRVPLDVSALGQPVVLACLPDEMHGLGLEMVALEIAAAGRHVLILGPNTPIDEIVNAADSLKAAVVGLSVSAFASTAETANRVVALRAALPKRIPLWIGGSGAGVLESLPKGVKRLDSLDDVAAAVRTLLD